MNIQRLLSKPIITPDMSETLGININGPSLIRVPEWLPNPLGKYYLYFAHHLGEYIRLAYADELTGPWQIYEPGTLQLEQTPCHEHIASPDIQIDEENQRLIMYYHGRTHLCNNLENDLHLQIYPELQNQRTFVATSDDGLHFFSQTEIVGPSYFRVFYWDDWVYALGMPGFLLRSQDGLTNFEMGPCRFNPDMRHAALLHRGNRLSIFYSDVGDCPEYIKVAHMDLTGDWHSWQESEATPVLYPEYDYEGVNLESAPSERGAILKQVRELRDPAIYVEDDKVYLLYSVAGESGLAIAEITEFD